MPLSAVQKIWQNLSLLKLFQYGRSEAAIRAEIFGAAVYGG